MQMLFLSAAITIPVFLGGFAVAENHTDVARKVSSHVEAKNIVIVHGAFADGSGWEGVYRILKKKGYNVTIVQNPLVSLEADVTATENVLSDLADPKNKNYGPVVLVGHSYGGAVITQAGNSENVKSLVYVAAYVPAEGESVGDLLNKDAILRKANPNIPTPPILIDDKKGIALLDRSGFSEAFAADVAKINPEKTNFMASSQAPLGLSAVGSKITKAAWRTRPSYYIVASEDHMIPPANERAMARMATKANAVLQFEFKASHAVYLSLPEKVAKVIEEAASN
jgi:pimeloyl-ACP methyl ester carboxylesterase